MPPRSSADPHASVADVAACRATLRGGSRTFFAASLALPKSVRKPATALYAFCRMADDAIDLGCDREAALDDLRRRLERVYAGAPRDTAADRAFADCVSRFSIPIDYPLALLEGFAWDAQARRYDDLSQLRAYGVRVAGTVGAMMAMVMNVREPRLLARACDLGVAMQFTNIARDVGEDARCGRLYLPQGWLRAAGVDPDAWLSRPVFNRGVAAVVERLLAEADVLYARSEAGLAELPAACRPGMFAARLLYAEIGREVARRGFDSVTGRAVVPWRRKARLLADAALAAQRGAVAMGGGMMAEGAFLLAALPAALPAAQRDAPPPLPAESPRERARWPKVEDRVVWMVDLFERLERRERSQPPIRRSDAAYETAIGTAPTAS
jgi:phytoene synthase